MDESVGNGTFVAFLWFAAGWAIAAVTSMPLSQARVIINCAYPMIRWLKTGNVDKYFDLEACKRFFNKSFAINAVLYTLVIILIQAFAHRWMRYGFYIGVAGTVIKSLGAVGFTNPTNREEFSESLWMFRKNEIVESKDELACKIETLYSTAVKNGFGPKANGGWILLLAYFLCVALAVFGIRQKEVRLENNATEPTVQNAAETFAPETEASASMDEEVPLDELADAVSQNFAQNVPESGGYEVSFSDTEDDKSITITMWINGTDIIKDGAKNGEAECLEIWEQMKDGLCEASGRYYETVKGYGEHVDFYVVLCNSDNNDEVYLTTKNGAVFYDIVGGEADSQAKPANRGGMIRSPEERFAEILTDSYSEEDLSFQWEIVPKDGYVEVRYFIDGTVDLIYDAGHSKNPNAIDEWNALMDNLIQTNLLDNQLAEEHGYPEIAVCLTVMDDYEGDTVFAMIAEGNVLYDPVNGIDITKGT